MGTTRFIVKLSKADKRYFTLCAKNGEIILTSEEYESKGSVYKGIESVRVNSAKDDMYKKFVGDDGQYYFNLRAANNKVIGVSEGYKWRMGRWIGIRSVRTNAPDALVDWVA
jgi:uncharacterized protein YegP (UPF0339 family)